MRQQQSRKTKQFSPEKLQAIYDALCNDEYHPTEDGEMFLHNAFLLFDSLEASKKMRKNLVIEIFKAAYGLQWRKTITALVKGFGDLGREFRVKLAQL